MTVDLWRLGLLFVDVDGRFSLPLKDDDICMVLELVLIDDGGRSRGLSMIEDGGLDL